MCCVDTVQFKLPEQSKQSTRLHLKMAAFLLYIGQISPLQESLFILACRTDRFLTKDVFNGDMLPVIQADVFHARQHAVDGSLDGDLTL